MFKYHPKLLLNIVDIWFCVRVETLFKNNTMSSRRFLPEEKVNRTIPGSALEQNIVN